MPVLTSSRLVPALLLLPSLVLAELKISGVDGEIERNIRAYVALASEPCDAEAWRVRRRFRSVEADTRKALEPYGYYTPRIESSLSLNEQCWLATLSITPGEPVKIRDVDIVIAGAAAADPAFADLRQPATLVPGATLRHAHYDGLKRTLQVRAADRGYIEAEFVESRLDVWPETGHADVTLHFNSGPRYDFGEVIQEQTFLNPMLVDGFIDIPTGTPFDNQVLMAAHQELSASAYFSQVAVVPDIANAENGRIPIRITLQPGKRIEYTVGVGASTDTGIRFRAGFRNNRLNLDGHRLITDLGISPVLQGITTEYRIPLRDPRREWFSITGALSNEETDTFDNEAQRLGIRWTHAISRTWLRTLSLDVSNESFNVADDVDTTRLVVPAIAFDHKLADRDIFPQRGRRIGLQLRGTDPALGSSTSFVQAKVQLRWIRSVGEKNRILTRLNAGTTALADFANLPPSVRFFAGGDESIRGYDYDSLGPVDADGNVIGGTNLLVGSVEYERHLRGNFYGAAFVDAGNAFDDNDFDPEVGAGLGLKWLSPLGPIRLYLGYPVTADDGNVRLHLRLGADL